MDQILNATESHCSYQKFSKFSLRNVSSFVIYTLDNFQRLLMVVTLKKIFITYGSLAGLKICWVPFATILEVISPSLFFSAGFIPSLE